MNQSRKTEEERTLSPEESKSLHMGEALIKNHIESLIPQSSPGRGKRNQRQPQEQIVFLDAVQSFAIGQPTEDLQEAIQQAFKDPNSTALEIILEAKAHFLSLSHNTFSRSVMEARGAWIILDHRLGRTPTKAEVIEHVREKIGDAAFPKDATTRWSEVFNAAGLKDRLDTAKPKRGKSRHG
jgi:hypothetical protein